VEFRILGPLEVVDAGRTVPLGAAKQRALLAILVLRAGEVVAAERLADELWGERPPRTALHTIQVYVSALRKALAQDGVLVTRPPGYALQAGREDVDLGRFELLFEQGRRARAGGDAERAADLLREALALWRGPALADFAYEPFAQAAAERLEELRFAALEERVEADLALGRHAELVPELEALVREHPLREQPRAQLMLALYRAGRQAEALAVYQDTRRALLDELGIDPGPALQRLERGILNQDEALDWARPAAAAPAAVAAPTRSILLAPADEAELAALLALAEPLARSAQPHELILAGLVTDAAELPRASAALGERRAALAAAGVQARAAAFTTDDPAADLVRLASQQDVDLLLLPAPRAELDDRLRGVLEEAPCDVALHLGGAPAAGAAVVVPFGAAGHDWSALEVGAWLAGANGVPLRLVGTTADPLTGRRDASRLLAGASLAVQRLAGVDTEPRLVEPGPEAVVRESADALAVVLSCSDRWREEGIGAARAAIAAGVAAPTLVVRRGLRPGGLTPPEGLTRFGWSLAGSG
jgi:DNA-binding SARP family transcriptional activator